MISRRNLLGVAVGIAAMRVSSAGAQEGRSDPLLPLWQAWKRIHVSSGGRVIDRLQDNVCIRRGRDTASWSPRRSGIARASN